MCIICVSAYMHIYIYTLYTHTHAYTHAHIQTCLSLGLELSGTPWGDLGTAFRHSHLPWPWQQQLGPADSLATVGKAGYRSHVARCELDPRATMNRYNE